MRDKMRERMMFIAVCFFILLFSSTVISGTITYTYDPYGKVLKGNGSTVQPFTFVGAWGVRQEGDGGIYHMRARYYDANTGRFMSREPIWPQIDSPRELNPYQYAANNPVSLVDFTGLDVFEDIAFAIVISNFNKLKSNVTFDDERNVTFDDKVKILAKAQKHFGVEGVLELLPDNLKSKNKKVTTVSSKRETVKKAYSILQTTAPNGPRSNLFVVGIGNDVRVGDPGSSVWTNRFIPTINNLPYGPGSNLLVGGIGNDVRVGDPGSSVWTNPFIPSINDQLGGPGSNLLVGGIGNDVLVGGIGKDVLVGGPESNVLTNLHPDEHEVMIGSDNIYISGPGSNVRTNLHPDQHEVMFGSHYRYIK